MLVKSIEDDLKQMDVGIQKENRAAVVKNQVKALIDLDRLGTMLVREKPFKVPDDLAPSVPRFYGRALVEVKLKNAQGKVSSMNAIIDGINSPLSAGNFLDLVEKGFYNNIPISFKDESTIVTGDPDGPDDGYKIKGALRTVPLEIRPEKAKVVVTSPSTTVLTVFHEGTYL